MKLKAVLVAALLGLVRGDIEVVQQAATPRAAPEGPFAGTGSMLRGGEAFDIGKVADARKLIIPIPPDSLYDTNAPTTSPPTGSPTVYGAYWDPRSDSVPECWPGTMDIKVSSASCLCNFYCAASDRHYTYATGQCGGCQNTRCDDIGKLIRVVDVTGGQDCVLDNARPRPGCKCGQSQ
jgi:hypothetical protein